MTTNGSSAAATSRHACNLLSMTKVKSYKAFCQPKKKPASRNGRSGAPSQQPAPQYRRYGPPPPFAFPHARGHEWATILVLGTGGPLPSASDPANGPTAISPATRGERTPGECWPQLAGPKATFFPVGFGFCLSTSNPFRTSITHREDPILAMLYQKENAFVAPVRFYR